MLHFCRKFSSSVIALRVEIIKLYYDMPIRGHEEQWKIVELVKRNFWWSDVTRKIKRYIEECDSY